MCVSAAESPQIPQASQSQQPAHCPPTGACRHCAPPPSLPHRGHGRRRSAAGTRAAAPQTGAPAFGAPGFGPATPETTGDSAVLCVPILLAQTDSRSPTFFCSKPQMFRQPGDTYVVRGRLEVILGYCDWRPLFCERRQSRRWAMLCGLYIDRPAMESIGNILSRTSYTLSVCFALSRCTCQVGSNAGDAQGIVLRLAGLRFEHFLSLPSFKETNSFFFFCAAAIFCLRQECGQTCNYWIQFGRG